VISPIAKPPYTQDNTNRLKVGFELTIPVIEAEKIFHALDSRATVIGVHDLINLIIYGEG
jgi:hypothetical protein